MFIEDKKENTIIGKTIVCDYYSEYYLTEIKKYLFKMKLWKEKDFIEDLLLHYDVNKYYDEKENDNSV